MLDLDLTNAINKLCEGKAGETEQKVCGLVLKNLMSKKGAKPNYNENGKPYCPNCNQPVNTKLKNGKHIFEYCKCCGQKIDWDECELVRSVKEATDEELQEILKGDKE